MANTQCFPRCSVLLLILISLIVCVKLDNCSHGSNYQGVWNRALHGHVLAVKTAGSVLSCAKYCLANPACASFNYANSGNLCQLNDATRNDSDPSQFVKRAGSTYYESGPSAVSDSGCSTSLVTDSPVSTQSPLPTSCKQLLATGYKQSGVYTIYPDSLSGGLQVYCDQTDNGGGWIVFQRRQDGTVDFYRDWNHYRAGFGSLTGEFWLGNDNLRNLTESNGGWTLQIDLEDFQGQKRTAAYSSFKIMGDKYVLEIGSFSGDAGDALWIHNNKAFTTQDEDNDKKTDGNCAQLFEGAWWFDRCHWSHLNGKYYPNGAPPLAHGVQWGSHVVWDSSISLKKTTMKIRESE
ncbi:ficolin-2-like [Patiria miniata]|uniref:Fibrinogen C-terminal domain-containing protein n=1 Tax=Patiria miniata TaxID=46514 RepID=A0A914B6B0_PATMI|nr:ficolin-2-like [Patiria miniata]